MDLYHPDAEQRASAYLAPSDHIARRLGAGIDGAVYETTRSSAVKVIKDELAYKRELAAYLRLREHCVKHIGDHEVPPLLNFSHRHQIVEMTLVKRPYILDFGKALLDQEPDFDESTLCESREQQAELFGENAPMALWIQ
jgi:hypothetical protein